MSLRSKKRASAAVGTTLTMMVSLCAAISLAPAQAQDAPAGLTGVKTIVGLGDSYMSGEGVIYANHNFKDAAPSGSSSNWQTAPGALGGAVATSDGTPTNTAVNGSGNVWRSVFGDKNGYPATGGEETIPWCDRSYAAAVNIGAGWNAQNLACSGATSNTQIGKDGSWNKFKPGVDFKVLTNPAPTVSVGYGQAKMLQDAATANPDIEAVSLSIGGNDFGFGDIGSECVKQASLGGGKCENDPKVQAMVANGLKVTPGAVESSIANIVTAMTAAGYKPGSWKLIYQNPPLPIGKGADTKYTSGFFGGDRGSIGGCSFGDSTLDWVVGTVYPGLVGAMEQGVMAARDDLGATPLVLIDTEKTFERHRLCGKDTIGQTNYAVGLGGKNPKWQDDNGKKTEWVTYISRVESLSGNTYQKQMPLHPNYWGQRALSGCLSDAVSVSGSVKVACEQDPSDTLDNEGRPKMDFTSSTTLWITASGKPTITGLPNVGQTLTADGDDAFSPSGNYDYAYEWSADGTAIPGANAATYQLVAADLGKTITVKVTASSGDLEPASATSDGVDVSDIVVNTKPSISGSTTVGSTLTANPGTYTPTPDSFTYQWSADGTPIVGATATTFVATVDQLGKKLTVKVAATKAGFESISLNSSETAEITEATTLAVTGAPTISGDPEIGQTLTANPAGVTFTPGADRVAYQWSRGGTEINGATEATYEVTADDQGATLTVRVVGYLEGFGSVTSDPSAPTATVDKGTIKRLKTPKIKHWNQKLDSYSNSKKNRLYFGRAVEVDLTGTFNIWPNDPDVQWYRVSGGVKSAGVSALAATKIKGADVTEYTLRKKDVGNQIYATIQTTDAGYNQASAQTLKYRVLKGKRIQTKRPKVVGKVRVNSRLVAKNAKFRPATTSVRYRWLRNGKPIAGANKRGYTPVGADRGTRLRVRVIAKPTSTYRMSAATSRATKRVGGSPGGLGWTAGR